MTLFDLSGKVALISGGNGGIGLAIAEAFAEAGAQVVIGARDRAKARAAVARVGKGCIDVPLDVTDPASVTGAAEAVRARFGRCDVLVASAGMNIRKPPADITLEDWDQVLRTNLTGTLLLAQALHPLMRDGGGGKIICLGSMYSLFGAPMVAAYAASKGGVVQLAKSLAAAWAADNIQVNAILPGWVETDLTARARQDVPTLNDSVLARTPAGRWGQPEDVAGSAVFLASRASDFVTGAVLAVDGGYSIRG